MRLRGEPNPNLTAREREMVACILDGCVTRKQIGIAMHICQGTVYKHLEAIYQKTNTRCMPELVLWAVHAGYKVTAYDDKTCDASKQIRQTL